MNLKSTTTNGLNFWTTFYFWLYAGPGLTVMKHASLDSQGRDEDCEIVPMELPNPEKKIGAASAGFLSLFTWQSRIGCYGNLFD